VIGVSLDISLQERPMVRYVGAPVRACFAEFGAPGGPNEQIPRLYGWLSERGTVPLGGPLYIYRHLGPSREETVDLTVAVPVSEPVVPGDGLVFGGLPAGTYLVGHHRGSPDGIERSRAEVETWAAARGLALPTSRADDGLEWTGFAEHFLTDPAEEPDPTRWEIDLLYLLD